MIIYSDKMSKLTKICLYFKTLSYTAVCNGDHVLGAACAWGRKRGGALVTDFVGRKGSLFFFFDLKLLFIYHNHKEGGGGKGSLFIKKNRKNRYNMRFLSMNCLGFFSLF